MVTQGLMYQEMFLAGASPDYESIVFIDEIGCSLASRYPNTTGRMMIDFYEHVFLLAGTCTIM